MHRHPRWATNVCGLEATTRHGTIPSTTTLIGSRVASSLPTNWYMSLGGGLALRVVAGL